MGVNQAVPWAVVFWEAPAAIGREGDLGELGLEKILLLCGVFFSFPWGRVHKWIISYIEEKKNLGKGGIDVLLT